MPLNKESILNTCRIIAKKGEVYHVNKYRWTENKKRKLCFQLKADGKLLQGATHNKLLTFYRPEDIETLKSHQEKFNIKMKKIHRENCYTMIKWWKKEKDIGVKTKQYYWNEFWKHKHLAWHYGE